MSFFEREHTADVLMHIRGATKEELYEEAGRALFSVMFPFCTGGEVIIRFDLNGTVDERLLHDYLSEILFYAEVEGVALYRAEVTFTPSGLSTKLFGEPYQRERHKGGTEVKGISLSEMKITRTDNGWCTLVLFDV